MTKLHQRVQLSAEWISAYAKSIGAPMQTLNGVLIAPATMPVIFWKGFDIPWLHMNKPLIHGSQRFSYEAPITADMTLDCELSLTKIEKKAGKQGELTFYTHSLVCKCEGEHIVTAETVLIAVGGGI
ncbi:hypothetical protein GRF59_04020 [Paenibacillus sp. HJL G12]|uniref:FAS1-like dehydratase domain-containing protein n=1 Tax=Paenibacillus dendrobii TaxID=2691084 RepID=A0A7X3LG24_9BACL|nr:MaoC family dehydratase N-terminal domain-containing protein [Paenibacillus dendrobii]MWV42785.1 hypothetical protein [Paenibacillus dendrobii]